MEKLGKWAPEKAAVAGFGPDLALDESGAEESHGARTLHTLICSAADSASALD